MVNLTFADDADALDAELAAFTSDLNNLTQADPAGSGRPDTRTGHTGREKGRREGKRLIRSARRAQASLSAQRYRRPTHKEAIPSASRGRQRGRRPTVRGRLSQGSGRAPAQSGAALKAAISWIRMRL